MVSSIVWDKKFDISESIRSITKISYQLKAYVTFFKINSVTYCQWTILDFIHKFENEMIIPENVKQSSKI